MGEKKNRGTSNPEGSTSQPLASNHHKTSGAGCTIESSLSIASCPMGSCPASSEVTPGNVTVGQRVYLGRDSRFYTDPAKDAYPNFRCTVAGVVHDDIEVHAVDIGILDFDRDKCRQVWELLGQLSDAIPGAGEYVDKIRSLLPDFDA